LAWTPATGEIRYWSEETYRVLGFDQRPGRRGSKNSLGAFALRTRTRVRELFGKAIAEKADFETDYRIVHPNGDVKDIHAVGHPVCDEAGHLVEFVGTVIDITESKRSEGALPRFRAGRARTSGSVAQSLDVLATAPDPDKFVGQMLSTIGRLLNAQSVSLWLFDESADSLVLRLMAEGRKVGHARPGASIQKDPTSWKQNQQFRSCFSRQLRWCAKTRDRSAGQRRVARILKRKEGKDFWQFRFLCVDTLEVLSESDIPIAQRIGRRRLN